MSDDGSEQATFDGIVTQFKNGGSLKRVFGVREVTEDPPANSEHHRPVPSHQGFKRGLIPDGYEAL